MDARKVEGSTVYALRLNFGSSDVQAAYAPSDLLAHICTGTRTHTRALTHTTHTHTRAHPTHTDATARGRDGRQV